MAYMNQEKKAIIKAALDQALAGSGIKYSLKVDHYSSITCTIKSAPIDFIAAFHDADQYSLEKKYIRVNPYWFNDHFSIGAAAWIEKIITALKAANWYDKSDAMVDYFDIAYYIHLNIGAWNKPFKHIPAAPKKLKTMALDYYQDPGHGWVKIGLDKLAALGIAEDISGYSYMRNGYAYLEEDCDLSLLYKACDMADIVLKLREHTCDNSSKIRNYDRYNYKNAVSAQEKFIKDHFSFVHIK